MAAELDTSCVRVSSVVAVDGLVTMTLSWPSVADDKSYELRLTIFLLNSPKFKKMTFNATATVSVVFL